MNTRTYDSFGRGACVCAFPRDNLKTIADTRFLHGTTCVEQPAVVCRECTVADDVPSRAEDYFFGRRSTMIRRS